MPAGSSIGWLLRVVTEPLGLGDLDRLGLVPVLAKAATRDMGVKPDGLQTISSTALILSSDDDVLPVLVRCGIVNGLGHCLPVDSIVSPFSNERYPLRPSVPDSHVRRKIQRPALMKAVRLAATMATMASLNLVSSSVLFPSPKKAKNGRTSPYDVLDAAYKFVSFQLTLVTTALPMKYTILDAAWRSTGPIFVPVARRIYVMTVLATKKNVMTMNTILI